MADHQAQRGPVAADDLEVALGAAGHFVPGVQPLGLPARCALLLDRHAPARRAVTHAGEDVDDGARAVVAGQVRGPVRLVAVHVAEQLAVAVAVQLRLDFARVLLGERGGPLRRQSGMHHHPAQVAVHVQQLLHAQPVQQHACVVGQDHALQVRIDLALLVRRTLADGEQGQVVVAQHDDTVFAQRVHQAQRFQRLSAAVHQVAAEPQPVLRGVEADLLQQSLRGVVAALQVADGPDTHAPGPQCRVRGTDRVKGAMGASKRVPSSASMS